MLETPRKTPFHLSEIRLNPQKQISDVSENNNESRNIAQKAERIEVDSFTWIYQ